MGKIHCGAVKCIISRHCSSIAFETEERPASHQNPMCSTTVKEEARESDMTLQHMLLSNGMGTKVIQESQEGDTEHEYDSVPFYIEKTLNQSALVHVANLLFEGVFHKELWYFFSLEREG